MTKTVKTITEEDEAWVFGFDTRYDSKGRVEQVTEWVRLKNIALAQDETYISIMTKSLAHG